MSETDAVYEMLWDCAYCGTRKLLGKTHRFYRGCGAPQGPAKRYFPSDAEKAAVRDHVFVGTDRVCEACGSAMSARATHCTQCSSAMAGASEVKLVADVTPPPVPASPTAQRRDGPAALASPVGFSPCWASCFSPP